VPLFSASAVFSALVKYIGRPSSDCNEVTLRYVLGELRLGKYLQHNSEAPSPIGVFLDPPAVLAMMQLPRFQARAAPFPARLHRAPWGPAAPRLRGRRPAPWLTGGPVPRSCLAVQVPSALLNDFTRGVSLLYHAGAVGAGDGGAGNARGSALPAKRAKLEAPVRGRGSPWLAVGDVLRGFPTGAVVEYLVRTPELVARVLRHDHGRGLVEGVLRQAVSVGRPMLNKLGAWVLRVVGPDKYDNQFYPLSRLVSAAVLGRSVPLFLGRKAVQVAPSATAPPSPPPLLRHATGRARGDGDARAGGNQGSAGPACCSSGKGGRRQGQGAGERGRARAAPRASVFAGAAANGAGGARVHWATRRRDASAGRTERRGGDAVRVGDEQIW